MTAAEALKGANDLQKLPPFGFKHIREIYSLATEVHYYIITKTSPSCLL